MQHRIDRQNRDSKKKKSCTGFTIAAATALLLFPVLLTKRSMAKKKVPCKPQGKGAHLNGLDININSVGLSMHRSTVENLLGKPDLVYEDENLIVYNQQQQVVWENLILSQMGYAFNTGGFLTEVTAVAGFFKADAVNYINLYQDLLKTVAGHYGDPCSTYEFWWDDNREGYYAKSIPEIETAVKNRAVSIGNLIIGAEWKRGKHKCIATIDSEGLTVTQSAE